MYDISSQIWRFAIGSFLVLFTPYNIFLMTSLSLKSVRNRFYISLISKTLFCIQQLSVFKVYQVYCFLSTCRNGIHFLLSYFNFTSTNHYIERQYIIFKYRRSSAWRENVMKWVNIQKVETL